MTIDEAEIIAVLKYMGTAALGSGICTWFLKMLWGNAINEVKSLINEKHEIVIGKIADVEMTQTKHASDIKEIKKSLQEGGFRFEKIEEDMNKTQSILLDKIGGVVEQSHEYREKNREIFVTRLEIEGEIVKACQKHCKGHTP